MAKKVSYNTTAEVLLKEVDLWNRYKNFSCSFMLDSLAGIRLKPRQGQRFKVTIEKVGK